MSPGRMPESPRVDAWGIQHRYRDASHEWRQVPEATVAALRESIGEAPPGAHDRVRVLTRGAPAELDPGTIVLENGDELPTDGTVLRELPDGYHHLHRPDGSRIVLIVTPGVCPAPPERAWGWAVQLYAARSRESWGIGDLADARRLAAWARSHGARMLLLSPLGADTPAFPLEASPYHPSSRRFRSPVYLRVEDVPGARRLGSDLEGWAAEGRALNRNGRIDRDAVWTLKEAALSAIWTEVRDVDTPDMREFRAWRRDRGSALQDFATFSAIAEIHGRDWRSWPSELRRPDAPAVRRFASERKDRVEFHVWLQWLLERQAVRASEPAVLMHDLPIGVDAGGADAWAWQDLLAEGVGVGAPPDAFNPRGQDWGLPPFIPWKLRAAGYGPFIETLRTLFAHGGWARIDHVMGLFRLFWIPSGMAPGEGAYVRYPSDELLGILALEANRAGAVVVGEDLGTVEEGVREELSARNILSYRLLWFEDAPPEAWPERAMAAVTTHDLPTIAGVWSGAELGAQRAAGIDPDTKGLGAMRGRLASIVGPRPDVGVDGVVERVYRRLGHTPCRLVSATLDDAMAVEERPNMPDVPGRPNWCIALPRPIEALEEAALPGAIASALGGD